MWKVYDALIDGMSSDGVLARCSVGAWWTAAQTDGGDVGLAMTTPHGFVAPMYPDGLAGLSLRRAAEAVKSWNLDEASLAMAAVNAFYNTRERIAALRAAEPYDNWCTAGLDVTNKVVGVVGHLKFPAEALAGAKSVFFLDRHPQEGDYPDSACDYLLPEADVAIITGSSLVNKTLPHLLELCKNAYTILTGPTVPLCPALLYCGIDRLSGMAVTDPDAAMAHAGGSRPGPPYRFGETFLLER